MRVMSKQANVTFVLDNLSLVGVVADSFHSSCW